MFDAEGRIHPDVSFAHLAAHVWFSETGTALASAAGSPLLGVHEGTAYYLLFNGILGDKKPDGGNVLTSRVLRDLPAHDGPKVIYGEATLFGSERLRGPRPVPDGGEAGRSGAVGAGSALGEDRRAMTGQTSARGGRRP